MPPTPLLVTGCYRSGTTVVEKLLHSHPAIVVASQPAPILYFLVKQRFLDARGLERRYPLDHLFGERDYTRADLAEFLGTYVLTAADLETFWSTMRSYTEGLWTPEMIEAEDAVGPGTFLQVRDALNTHIAALFPKEDPSFVGGKEVLVEELVPYLAGSGTEIVLVMRDPRAMIASLNFRVRDNQTGDNRPLLYSLRAWRKSVATLLSMAQHPRFHWLRYEDLVTDQRRTLDELTSAMGVAPFAQDAFSAGIADQWGRPWSGNSSFDDKTGVSASSLRTFEDRLPGQVQAFIESVCRPELLALGYEPTTAAFDADAVRDYRDPFVNIHGRFESGYSSDPQRVADELRRWDLLGPDTLDLDERQQTAWFLHPAAYDALRSAVAQRFSG